MSYYVIIPYSYMMRMLYENEVFLLLVVFGVGTQHPCMPRCWSDFKKEKKRCYTQTQALLCVAMDVN